jgi:hypothetical protein
VAKKKKTARPADAWVPSSGSSYWRNVEPLVGSRQAGGPKDELHMLATALAVTALAGLCAFIISSSVAATITTLGAACADILATLVGACGVALGALFGLLGDAFAMVWAILGLPWTALFRALGYATSAHRRFASTSGGAPPRAYQYPPTTGFLPNSAATTVLPPTSMAPYFPPGAAERYPVGAGGGQVYGEGHMQLRRAELFHKGRCGSSRPDVELCDALKQRRWAGAKDAFDRPPRYGVPVGGVPPGAPGGFSGGAASYAAGGTQSWCAAPAPAQCGAPAAAKCGAPQPVCSPPPPQVPIPEPKPEPVAAEADEFTQCAAKVEQEFAPKLEAARKESERAQRQASKPSLLRRFTTRLTGKQQAHPGLGAGPASLVVPGTLSVGADGAACRAARERNNATLLALRAAQAELQSAVGAATDAHAACHAMLEKDIKAAGGVDHVACVQKGDALSQVAESASTAVEALAKEAAIKMQTTVMMCGGSASN